MHCRDYNCMFISLLTTDMARNGRSLQGATNRNMTYSLVYQNNSNSDQGINHAFITNGARKV